MNNDTNTTLNAAAIAAGRAASASHVAIEVVAATGSTNADLLARLPGASGAGPRAGLGQDASIGSETGGASASVQDQLGDTGPLDGPTLRIAHVQTAGRGRAGRPWLSAPGASLTFSLAWPFKAPLQRLAGLPLAVGVAIAETVAALGVPVQLKWPNDVLRDGAKLAGILVETQSAPDGRIWAVIGCGMNLLLPDELEAGIGRSDVASAPWLAQMERNALVAALLNRLSAVLAEFDDTGFAAFAERWNALQAWRGEPVNILDQGRIVQQGLAAGVDDIGRLLLDTPSGRVAVLSGDVSLRRAA